jgi:ketosteroid isomerase-like protein
MHANAETLREFYAAFGRRDAKAMAAFYAPEAEFSDPVFPALKGAEVPAMWAMLCERAKDFSVEASGFEADDTSGKAHWDANYTFSATGRHVLNRIDASFTFEDGKIVRHRDAFDLWKWASQAMGLKGQLLGWLPPVQNAIRKQADAGLRIYMKKAKG